MIPPPPLDATVSQSFPDLIDDLNAAIAKLRAGAPEPMRAFSALARESLKPGALDVKTKELIAVAIAIATRCDGCIGFHAKAAIKAGATREEILETLSMAIPIAISSLVFTSSAPGLSASRASAEKPRIGSGAPSRSLPMAALRSSISSG